MANNAASLLSRELTAYLTEKKGISRFNSFQEQAIPHVHSGKDALLIAPTAGGKTEAAVLPLLERAAAVGETGVKLVYVAPLRALLNDIEPRISAYAAALGLRAFKWHGDVSAQDKRRAEKNPPDVLLITPESLEVILVGRRSPVELFSQLQSILIDEVHYFAGSGRGAHLLSLISRLERIAGRPAQRVGLSATVGNPERILEWLSGPDRPKVLVAPSGTGDSKKKIWEVVARPPNRLAEVLLPKLVKARPDLGHIGLGPRTIVFCRSRAATESVSKQLDEESKLHPGIRFKHRVHHSSVGRDLRETAESELKLRDADSRCVVATSTLELGIDLGDLDLVVATGSMSTASSFLQRVGRVGRRAGSTQWFISLNVEPGERDPGGNATWSFLKNLAILNLGARGIVEDVEPVPKAFHLLAQQVLAISMSRFGFQVDRDLGLLLATQAFADITRAEAEEVLGHMLAQDILRDVPPNLVIGGKGERLYLQRNALPLFSVFDTPQEFTVLDGANEIGTVDAVFIVGQDTPFDLRLAGRNWRALEVSFRHAIVKVTPAEEGAPPYWWSTGPGTSRVVVEEIARILDGAELASHIALDPSASRWLSDLRKFYRLPIHELGVISVESIGDTACRVAALAGDRVMTTLALGLEANDDFETSKRNAVQFGVKRIGPDARVISPEDVAAAIRDLLELDEEELTRLLASVIDDDESFNKFAPCVPRRLRRLHLACSVTNRKAVKLFWIEGNWM